MALRVRPLFEKENNDWTEECISYVHDEPQIYIGQNRSFTFDFVYPPNLTQEEVYKSSIMPLLDHFTEGLVNQHKRHFSYLKLCILISAITVKTLLYLLMGNIICVYSYAYLLFTHIYDRQTGSGKTYSIGTGLEPCSNPLDQGLHRILMDI